MLLVAIVFAIFLVIGMPVAFAIGISGMMFFLQHPELPISIPLQITVSTTQNFSLLAVPLFIVAGNLMNRSGITEGLLNLASVLTGRLRGGLAQISIVLSALMGGVSGSAIADAAMQSRMLGQQMIDRGMTKGFAAGVLSFSSLLTPIIPPGIGMILFGTIGSVSIGRLFAGGILPALLLGVAMSLSVWITATKRGYPPERSTRPTAKETITAFRGGIWAILFPVILLVGLRAGIFTPSEIGAVAVLYAVFIGFLIYKRMKVSDFIEALESSLGDVGSVMFLISLSAIFGYGIVFERLPELVASGLGTLTDNVQVVMVLIVLLTIVAGLFVDATVLIIMMTPIVLPVVTRLGGDPVHFGIIFVIAATLGNFTPPVGAAMYTVCSILNVSIKDYIKEGWPLLLAISIVTVLLIFVPSIVLYIPNLIFG
ncbi:TRAP transporter large permease subunit [Phyllobacterium sp. 0TCS1.6C]|uniref:TRAP transporter large permease n=1 Tax=unclassified Phyllobacterium TaxID=2638441 RepID=UPI002263BEDE|nr:MULTISPECIES: TRAP transporter large permease subunit [unclassified Phyllobacterium]MCX8279041.1 TRAP transporter large permease subunit [Phyllobacterium sp. 0TCS1.6C]MCX8293825.1 TRAP transporter large permease subunit [Phyllobacterium sp. 0TCS1.6A]